MRRLFIYIFILVLLSGCTQSRKYENLEVLCKVWGFVKYHHPVFADSTTDIDAELFKLLPLVTDANKPERNRALSDWITELGEFQENKARYDSIENNSDCRLLADLKWIDNFKVLGRDLSDKLKSLRYADRDGNRYVRYESELLDCSNEKKYGMKYPAIPLRLLSLFRYWNLIEYYSPYRDLTDKDWSDVLTKYLPLFIDSDDARSYRLSVFRLFTELCDSHAVSESSFIFGSRYIPVEAQMINGKLIVKSIERYASLSSTGLLPGDEILKIDENRVRDIKNKVKRYVSSSTEAHHLSACSFYALESRHDNANVCYRRDGIIQNSLCSTVPVFDIYPLMLKQDDYYRNLGDSIGYLHFGGYKEDMAIYDSIEKTKAVVIDLRTYPTNDVFGLVKDYFFPDRYQITILTLPIKYLPGYFKKSEQHWGKSNNTKHYSGKIIVLVNEETQSAAEHYAMALQAIPGTVVIGSETSGADGNVVRTDLPGGILVSFSGIGVYYPDGTPLQRIGVKIDEIVKPTIRGIKEGRDEVLERAIEIINES